MTIKYRQHSSGTAMAVIAETTSVNATFTANALEDTNQADALVSSFVGGKCTVNVSGDYLFASDGGNYDALFAIADAGDKVEVDIYRNTTLMFTTEGVFTSLNATGSLSDALATGSYSMEVDVVALDLGYGPELFSNWDFSNWTGDDPDDWILSGEVASDPMVTEVAGGARFYTSGGVLTLRQGPCAASTNYHLEVIIASDDGGTIRVLNHSSATVGDITDVGTTTFDFINTGANVYFTRVGATDMTIESISIKEIL